MTRGDDEGVSRGAGEGADRPQDPIVERVRPDPAQPPERTLTLTGFLGDSDREGYRRVYFTQDLDYYAEFRDEDVLHTAAIPADALPFPGEEATRVTIRRDAKVDYTRTRTGRPLDEFDIDVRFGRRVRADFFVARHTYCDALSCADCLRPPADFVPARHTECDRVTCYTCPPTACECPPPTEPPGRPCPPPFLTDVCMSKVAPCF